MIWFSKVRRAQTKEDFETWQQGGVANTLNAFDMGDVRTTMLIIEGEDMETYMLQDREGSAGGGKGPLVSEEKSFTLSSTNMKLFQPGDEGYIVRRLTPTECERLQGFPDGWTSGQADSHRYKQMGNAVTVNVAAVVGGFIMGAEHDVN